ncbi:MAG: CheY-P phosphatase CheX [Syntrophus sp. PtaU1.Bin005]|jgi:chemotaxis protein CheX|uniref:chemotaxis protein CheX n=1 Tax=Syntrophus TaxID=43773 RepID=UPI0009C46077|nr:MAG: CheY-P phosphatase CheX [Syntrophus sp. PtaB.Bin138]OPY82532.1 MAG: CheY-P phosphatase CheX [Syntrophus sp. PtaU1.Bin005]
MDVRFINAFLDATENVLKTMAFVEPKPGKPYLKKDNVAKGDISGIIGLTGDLKGSLGLSFSEGCIVKIVSNMLGESMSGIDNDVKDAVGEITNMISGVARKKLEADGLNITAAIPTVVAGKSHSIVHVLGGPSIIIPFEIEEGPFVVDFCLDNAPS